MDISRNTRLTTAMTASQRDSILNEVVRRSGNQSNGVVTLATNAGTVSKLVGKITTESLTTAAAGSVNLAITNAEVAEGDIVMVTRNGGSSTNGTPTINVTVVDGGFTIVLTNRHASAAFNGTFVFGFQVLKIPTE